MTFCLNENRTQEGSPTSPIADFERARGYSKGAQEGTFWSDARPETRRPRCGTLLPDRIGPDEHRSSGPRSCSVGFTRREHPFGCVHDVVLGKQRKSAQTISQLR
jgi:hypothetical protein